MSNIALIMVISVWSIVTFTTVYFFWRVLKTPARPEEDSFSENDNEQR